MIHWILQFTLRITVRCVLHRCASQDIHRWKFCVKNRKRKKPPSSPPFEKTEPTSPLLQKHIERQNRYFEWKTFCLNCSVLKTGAICCKTGLLRVSNMSKEGFFFPEGSAKSPRENARWLRRIVIKRLLYHKRKIKRRTKQQRYAPSSFRTQQTFKKFDPLPRPAKNALPKRGRTRFRFLRHTSFISWEEVIYRKPSLETNRFIWWTNRSYRNKKAWWFTQESASLGSVCLLAAT